MQVGRSAIIVGAGVIGMCSAYALAKRGWSVTLIDREDGPAMGASRANGAQLSYCFTDALGNPAVLAALPRLLSGKEGVSFGLSPNPAYLAWLAQFARNCTQARFRTNTLAVLELAFESKAAMEALLQEHAIDFAHRRAGKVQLLYSPKDRSKAEMLRILKQRPGCEQQTLTRSELPGLDPALRGLDSGVIGAISTPSETVGDPYLFCRALLELLITQYGVTAHFGCDIRAIGEGGQRAQNAGPSSSGAGFVTLASGEQMSADIVVAAGGIDSNRLLAPLGQAIAVQPMKGYSFEMPATATSPKVSVTDGKRRLVFTNLGDRIRVAGIAELGNAARSIDPDRTSWLVKSAQECLPSAGDYSQAGRFWAGLRPVTPNSQPIIRRAGSSLAINTGHGALGWTLAMGSGERIAQLLDD